MGPPVAYYVHCDGVRHLVTQPRTRRRCPCASLLRWQAVAAYRYCLRGCARGWVTN